MPQNHDITIRRGNSKRVPLRFRARASGSVVPIDLTGSKLVFVAVWDGGSSRFESGIDNYAPGDDDTPITSGWSIPIPSEGDATLFLSHIATRGMPVGSIRYEIERRVGGEQYTVLWGFLKVEEWTNDD